MINNYFIASQGAAFPLITCSQGGEFYSALVFILQIASTVQSQGALAPHRSGRKVFSHFQAPPRSQGGRTQPHPRAPLLFHAEGIILLDKVGNSTVLLVVRDAPSLHQPLLRVGSKFPFSTLLHHVSKPVDSWEAGTGSHRVTPKAAHISSFSHPKCHAMKC